MREIETSLRLTLALTLALSSVACTGVLTSQSGPIGLADSGSPIAADESPPVADGGQRVADAGTPPPPDGIVELRIAPGTGRAPWNDEASIVELRVGDVLRVRNADDIPHTLHTFGLPCEHGDPILPGRAADHRITGLHEPSRERPSVYDHDGGPTARVWLRVRR